MAYQQKPGDGVLFKNNKKTTDKHPDYTGNILDMNGELFSLAAWVKEGKNGKFLSVRMSPANPGVGKKEDDGNSLPF